MTLRQLPSVDALAERLGNSGLPRLVVVEAARRAIAAARDRIRDGDAADAEEIARNDLAAIGRLRSTRVVNAAGVLLHTNLGRAPWPEAAVRAAAEAAGSYVPVELDLATGRRGGRGTYLQGLLASLTGAGDALVVNNNAGALLLALAALAGHGGVAVSRGELIEIGGSFRLPELMAASGARLVEVGTTNRTRLADYGAVAAEVSALLKVHPSNYRLEGFTAEAGYAELAALARSHGIPLIADIGSGLLDDRVPWLDGPPPAWLAGEPGARQVLEDGAEVVLFSGDKLLGGPQAGLVVGGEEAVMAMRRHPIARAVRCDGSTLAALEATLEIYADGRGAEVPFWEMAGRPADIGSGLLDDRVPWLDGPPPAWLAGEPGARQVLEDGAEVVLFSGDKLLGGPQAGLVVGGEEAVMAMRRHPIARAVRCDGSTLAALEATLEIYADGRGAEVPFWEMAGRPAEELRERSDAVIRESGVVAELVEDHSLVGAGSVPGQRIPGPVIRIPGAGDHQWRSMLAGNPPVLARRADDALLVDLRAVAPEDDGLLARALGAACR